MKREHVSKMAIVLSLLTAAMVSISASPALAGVEGLWSTVDGKSRVAISRCGDKFCGQIVWLKEPDDDTGNPKTDINNEDDKLKSRPILGMKLLHSFKVSGEVSWDNGKIYNPEDGKTYSSSMKLVEPEVLEVKGCVFIFCKSQVWNRVAE